MKDTPKNMDKLKRYIRNLTTPKSSGSRLGIRYWQERILLNLLFAATLMGFVVYFPSVALSIKERLWPLAIADTLIYLYVIFLLLSSGISYNFRALSFSAISYLLGLGLLFVWAPLGQGRYGYLPFPF